MDVVSIMKTKSQEQRNYGEIEILLNKQVEITREVKMKSLISVGEKEKNPVLQIINIIYFSC